MAKRITAQKQASGILGEGLYLLQIKFIV